MGDSRSEKPMVTGRFAPSPSGRMHVGNVYAALLSWLSARKQGGRWLLRIEDLDRERCRPEYAVQLMDDLRWLGLEWDEGPRSLADTQYFQSARNAVYQRAFDTVRNRASVYDCYCRRADVRAASAPHASDGTPVYSGRCRRLTEPERALLARTRGAAVRVCVAGATDSFADGHYGVQTCNLESECGDFIIRRANGTFAYQLAVVADDALMGVTEVVRGRDLLASTHAQRFLYAALGYPAPRFSHVPLLCAPDGRRLSKRDRDAGLGALRDRYTPQELIGTIMYLCGCIPRREPLALAEALAAFCWSALPTQDVAVPPGTL